MRTMFASFLVFLGLKRKPDPYEIYASDFTGFRHIPGPSLEERVAELEKRSRHE